MAYHRLLFLALLLIICSCRLGPTYTPPELDVPDQWKAEQSKGNQTACPDCWWEVFRDDKLNELELFAIQNSPNVYVAQQRIVEARGIAEVAASTLYPQAAFAPNYNTFVERFHFRVTRENAPSFINPSLIPKKLPSNLAIQFWEYILPINMNYEVDLWGKLRGQAESALFSAQAQEEAYRTLLLTLTSDLASSYFQLRALDTQIEILQATVDSRQKSLDLNQVRFHKGLTNQLDVYSADLELTNIKASLEDTFRQRALVEDMIASLMGVPASEFDLDPHPLEYNPPTIPAGIPSDVLLQRPDIAEAERISASEHAQIGVAYAAFFPSLSLTGILAYDSGVINPNFKRFLKWIGRYWQAQVNGSQTLFDGGYDEGNLVAAWAHFREASGQYQEQVIIAFREVEDALNNISFQQKQYDNLKQSVNSSHQRRILSTNRYLNGLTNYLDVLDSERTELNAQLNLTTSLQQRYISTIQLIKALGGSWYSESDCPTPGDA